MSIADLIVWIIGAFAVVGVICQWTAWHRYKVEFDHLKRTEIALSSMDIGGLIDALISGSGASGSSIIGHRLYQVRNIAKSPAPPSVADLSNADIERDDSRFESAFPNTLISILLILGLAGTLFSFKHIMADFPVGTESTVEIKKWMNQAYPAFGTAFLASLVGIFGTLVLLAVRTIVHNLRADLFDRLDRFTAGSLYSRFVQPDATDAATLILAGQQLLQTAGSFEKSVEKMDAVPASLKTSTRGLSDATDEMRAALQNAAGTFSEFKAGFAKNGSIRQSLLQLEETVKGFGQYTHKIASSLQDAVSGATTALLGVANSLKQTGDSVARSGAVVATANQSIEQCVATIQAGNADHAAKMDRLIASLSGIVETTNRNHREWNVAILPAIRAMTDSASKLESSITPLTNSSEAVVLAAEQIGKSTTTLTTAIQSQTQQAGTAAAAQRELIETAVTQLISAGEAQSKRMSASAEAIDDAISRNASANNDFLATLAPTLVDLPSQLLGFAEQQSALLNQIYGIGIKPQKASSGSATRGTGEKRGIFGWLKFWKK